MIRSNVGNVVTNAQQIMSVGATTFSALRRNLARADQALNNASEKKADKDTNPKELSPEAEREARIKAEYKKMQLDKKEAQIKKFYEKKDGEALKSVDDLMANPIQISSGSPQQKELNEYLKQNTQRMNKFRKRRLKKQFDIKSVSKEGE